MYPTTLPCEVCGQINENVQHAWWLHVTCKDHIDVPPAKISNERKKYELDR